MSNQNPPPEPEPLETRHAVTEKWRCKAMEKKYGWKLKRVEPKNSGLFKFDCVFQGKADFPDYMEDD